MKIPFHCPEGHEFRYLKKPLRFVREIGAGALLFTDAAGEPFTIGSTADGAPIFPDIRWALANFRTGDFLDPDATSAMLEGRQGSFLQLDREACLSIDKDSVWRFEWADAAIAAKIVKSKAGVTAFMENATVEGRRPKWRSLLRWVSRLEKGGGRIGALVNGSGRLPGQSQLSDLEDRLVHKWALAYWRPQSLFGFLEHKDDAAAMVQLEWDELVELGYISQGLGEEAPSSETVRERINSLECYSTHLSRYGRAAADARYGASGEPVPATRPFERIFMDGTEFEHSVFFSDDLRVPSAKMKGVMALDAFSQFVWPFNPFAGPYRAEMGMAALRAVMTPPKLSQEEFDEDPAAGLRYGIPSDVMIDRDRTLIPPRAVPSVVTIVNTVELAEAYHSDAKAKLERFHRFVKFCLRKLVGGQILSARSRYEPGYDPLKSTNVTRAQYVDLVEQCRLKWNSTPKRSLGNRSPNDIMDEFIASGANRLTDPREVHRALSSTPSKPGILTQDGLTYDNVHYRWNREGITSMLSLNERFLPFGKRLKDAARIEVSMRVWDDNLDMIEVLDPETREYIRMYSTDPGYTGNLPRWEHAQYQKVLRLGGGGRQTKRDKLRHRATWLIEARKTLLGKSFRERAVPTALLEGEEARLSGARAANPGCAHVPELHVQVEAGGRDRRDVPAPPPQKENGYAADLRSDPSQKISEELGTDEPEKGQAIDQWNFDDGAIDPFNDEE